MPLETRPIGMCHNSAEADLRGAGIESLTHHMKHKEGPVIQTLSHPSPLMLRGRYRNSLLVLKSLKAANRTEPCGLQVCHMVLMAGF